MGPSGLAEGGNATQVSAALAALPWALTLAPGLPPSTDNTVTPEVLGERIEASLNGERVRIAGNALVRYRDVSISAATLDMDTVHNVATASGDVRVEATDGVLTGDDLVYCLDSGSTLLTSATAALTQQTDAGKITAHFVGRELQYDEKVGYIVDGSFTTCDSRKPHYAIQARQLILEPDKGLTAKGARVMLYGTALPRVGTLTIGFGAEEPESSLAPRFGISKRDGLYFSTSMGLTRKGRRPEVEIDGRASVKNLFRGRAHGLLLGGEGRSVNAVVGINEDVHNELTRNLVLDRLPELSAVGQWPLGQRRRSGWHAKLAVGNYRESPGVAEAWRQSAEVGARHAVPLGRDGRLTAEMSFRQSFYEHGDSLGVATAAIGARGKIGRKFRLAATYVRRLPNGRSPFEFDDVDIERELLTRFHWRIGQWGIGAGTRYDLDQSRASRAELRLSKVFHCIQYGVSYDTVLREVGFRVSLPGL